MNADPATRQRWQDWATHEIGGDTPDEAAAAARSSIALGAAALVGDEDTNRRELLARVRARRASVHSFVTTLKPRGARLTTASMACSGLVTLLTAGPAFGGQKFTDAAQSTLNLPSNAIVWQSLCFLAVLASVGAAITTNMYKTHDMGAQLVKAESSQAILEGLEVLIEFGQLPVAEGVKLYQQAIAEIPFIPEQEPARASPAPK